jgi:hypothetical protein
MYLNDSSSNDSLNYGTLRQHNYTSSKSLNNNFATKLDSNNVDRFLNYNYLISSEDKNITQDLSNIKLHNRKSTINTLVKTNENLNIFNSYKNIFNFQFLNHPTKLLLLGSESDAKQYNNILKYSLNNKFAKKNFLGKDYVNAFIDKTDVNTNLILNNLTSFIQNNNLVYRFKNIKSNNLSYLSNEKNTRLVDNIFLKKLNPNLSPSENTTDSIVKNTLVNSSGNSYLDMYLNSSINWLNSDITAKLLTNKTTYTQSHVPLQSNNIFWESLNLDKYNKTSPDTAPSILRSKEESAPSYLFNSY